jgi:hypothetical protein
MPLLIRTYILFQGRKEIMDHISFIVLFIAVLVTAGCINNGNTIPATPTLASTRTPAHISTEFPVPAVPAVTVTANPFPQDTDDKKFLDATELCYANTPVINDTNTVLAFTVCMQHTPLPTGTCAKQFRSEVLASTTKDDDTTAGYQRATHNMQVARTKYTQCLARFP